MNGNFICVCYNNFIYSCNFLFFFYLFTFQTVFFISFECKSRKLQFGLRISSIEVSKQKLCITTSLFVYNETCSKDILPGVSPFSRTKGFRVISGKHICLCSFPLNARKRPQFMTAVVMAIKKNDKNLNFFECFHFVLLFHQTESKFMTNLE